MPAVLARHDRLAADGPAAVPAEVRSPRHGSAALARPRGAARARNRRQHRVELVQSFLERHDLAAALDQQLVAERRAAVHLERQSAEIPDALLARFQDRAALAPERARRRSSTQDGGGHIGGAALRPAANAAEQGKTRHRGRRVYLSIRLSYGPGSVALRPNPAKSATNNARPTIPTTSPTHGITKPKMMPTMMMASARPIMGLSFPSG